MIPANLPLNALNPQPWRSPVRGLCKSGLLLRNLNENYCKKESLLSTMYTYYGNLIQLPEKQATSAWPRSETGPRAEGSRSHASGQGLAMARV